MRLRTRIENTCKAHLEWVKGAQRPGGYFKTDYWANGQEMSCLDEDDAVDLAALSDTPFQILKFGAFAAVFDQGGGSLREVLRPIVHSWVLHLDNNNKRGFFAFSRSKGMPREDYQNYRLKDHACIWSALQVAHKLGLSDELEKTEKTKNKMGRLKAKPKEPKQLSHNYLPVDFQKIVLRRFSAQDPDSKENFLAVARSLSQARFLFRTRDTALFYDTKKDFFNQSSTLWNATIMAQKYHMDNQDSGWDSPLRYGLALLMATDCKQINSRSPKNMLHKAKSVLFQSSSASGILPGMLHAGTSLPKIFQHESRRDFYWHNIFETLYILWKVREKLRSEDVPDVDNTSANLKIGPGVDGKPVSHRRHLEMKSSVSVNNHIIPNSIVELSDEWLYRFPDFFDFEPKSKAKSYPNRLEDLKGILIDIPKTKKKSDGEKRDRYRDYLSEAEILSGVGIKDILSETRTAEKAKKRLIWTPQVDPALEDVYVDASPPGVGEEPAMMAKFFERHSRKEKYLGDDITPSLNVWRTEFHLSSYQLSEGKGQGKSEDDQGKSLSLLDNKRIRLGGMGFRFVGDLFDRYWTCHVLEFEPDDDLRSEDFKKRFARVIRNRIPEPERRMHPWRQRKVLELILFDRMLEKMIEKYREMVKAVVLSLKDILPHRKNDDAASSSLSRRDNDTASSSPDDSLFSDDIFLPEMNSYEYLMLRKQWPSLQFALQRMEKDLKETLEMIALWKTRQQDRNPEQPRWTPNDERKYRSIITKMTTSNNHHVRELERYQSKIQDLRSSLETRLSSIRDELNFQNAENIAYFTYITVIFLPLGFGAATMSTSGLPSGRMALDIFVAAIIILVPTILTLILGPRIYNSVLRPIFRTDRGTVPSIQGPSVTAIRATASASSTRRRHGGILNSPESGGGPKSHVSSGQAGDSNTTKMPSEELSEVMASESTSFVQRVRDLRRKVTGSGRRSHDRDPNP
ncbi:hypothetical protein A1O3_02951 [Capronia epimyces CBS 606.96]|uniref:Uncharacterized protein n=1 Tax=Capronia epimyces CBS 606.96 TaxID=1182542 RepID=W9Z5X8_9EURO|nr:uncharacterized protein A1O3_02951 [Capronia epimyces CBS 606.96]EXJ89884.1 hypothetical protein A1O3_02951 [Capronia epimyces CBS 606.96]